MYKLYVRLFFLMNLILGSTPEIIFAQGTSTDNCPASQFVDIDLGVVTPGTANNVRIEPAASAALAGKLQPGDPFEVIRYDFEAQGFPRIEPVCADGYLWIRIISQNISGWTVEVPVDGGDPFVVPYEEQEPEPVGETLDDGSIRVEEGGIAFTIPADLQIKRVLMQPRVGPLIYGRQCAFPNSANFIMEHEGEESLRYWDKSRLRVFPYALNESIYNYWDENVGQQLEILLQEKPDLLLIGAQMPWPPMCGAVALFGGAGRYLAFPGGDGLRFITKIAQADLIFHSNTTFTYIYRGLTADQNFLVTLDYLGVNVPASTIPAPISPGDDATYSTYLRQFETNLAAVPAAQFTPSLDLIDALIGSITLGDQESVMRLIPG